MFKNIKWLRLTPDRQGRGGTKTGFHSFQQTPINDVRSLQGGHVYRGYWRRDFDPVQYTGDVVDPNSVGAFGCLQIHGYTYPSLTDPAAAPTIKILEQNTHLAGVTVVWDATSGTTRSTRPGTNQSGTFTNIGGRCFFGDGVAEGLVMDDRTPAIHAQPNQLLGISAPTQPLQANASANISPWGTGYIHNTAGANPNPYLNHPDPNNLLGTCVLGDSITVAFPDANFPGDSGALPGAPAVLAANAVTSNVTPFSAAGTISITTGKSLVTLVGATWPALFQYAGLSINFNGFSFVILTHGPDATSFNLDGGATVLTNDQLLILGVYDGPTLTNAPYTITGCQAVLTAAGNSGASQINAGILGYSQSTNAKLVQVVVQCTRANGFFRNLGNISLGPVGGGTATTVTDGKINIAASRLGSASAPWVGDDVGKTIVVDEASSTNGLLKSTIQTFFSASAIQLADNNASGNNLTAQRVWWGVGFISCSDATMGLAPTTTVTAASKPWTVNDVGKTIMIDKAGPATGFAGANISLYTTITGFTNAGQITVGTPNTVAVSNVPAVWGSNVPNTHAGPSYAYAWYDPETGHCSNISPLFQVPKPTTQGTYPDFANITPFFQIDPGYLSYPTGASSTGVNAGTDGARFSHILFFRTLSTPGSSTLYPIGSLMPYVGKVHPGSPSTRGNYSPNTYHGWAGIPNNYVNAPPTTGTNYWYDFSSDSDLLLSGGFRAPQFTNSKPMSLLRGGVSQPSYPALQAYWDRRLWVVPTQEPDKIGFSCDEAQCPLGVPEESFPPTNFLRLPSAADGKVIGLRTVGDMLLVTTQRFAYIVAGNNESNYRLMKISSSMPGVGTYQMDEFPTYTGAEGEPSTLFYIGVDRIVYQWTVGGQVVPISHPIQDQLDTLIQPSLYRYARVHCISAWGRRCVVVAPFQQNASTGVLTFLYDLETQTWSTSRRTDGTNASVLGLLPMATVYGSSNAPVNEIYGIYTTTAVAGVHNMSWIRDDVATCSLQMRIDTFPMALDGKKTRKQIVAVNIHATSGTWTGMVNPNDQGALAFPFGAFPDPLDSIYAPTGVQGIVDDVLAQDAVLMAAQMNATGAPVVCYRVGLTITKNSPDVSPAALYAIDIGYIDLPDPGDGTP